LPPFFLEGKGGYNNTMIGNIILAFIISINFTLTAGQEYSSNIFQDSTGVGDAIFSVLVDLETGGDSPLLLFISPQYNKFFEHDSLSYFKNLMGVSYFLDLPGVGNYIKLGVEHLFKYSDGYTEYQRISFVPELKIYPTDQTMLKANYTYQYLEYADYFKESEHIARLDFSIFPLTRTTVKLLGDMGRKNVKLIEYSDTYVRPAIGRRLPRIPVDYSISEEALYRIGYGIRISRSLTDYAGVYFQYTRRNLIGGEAPSSSGSVYIDSDIYDDPYAYDLTGFMVGTTVYLPLLIKVNLELGVETRDYLNTYTADSIALRKDNLKYFYLALKKSFPVGSRVLDLNLDYLYNQNDSNVEKYIYNMGSFRFFLSFSM